MQRQLPNREEDYIFPSNKNYKNTGKLENEEEILFNIAEQLNADPRNMNVGCAIIRIPMFLLVAGLCLYAIVISTPTIFSMITEGRLNIFIFLGWLSVSIGAFYSIYFLYVCIRAIINSTTDYRERLRDEYLRLMQKGVLVHTQVIKSDKVGDKMYVYFSVRNKNFLYITRYTGLKPGEHLTGLQMGYICVIL